MDSRVQGVPALDLAGAVPTRARQVRARHPEGSESAVALRSDQVGFAPRNVRCVLAATLTLVAAARAHASPCEVLRSVSLPNTTIAALTLVDSGAFHLRPTARKPSAEFFTAFNTLPA